MSKINVRPATSDPVTAGATDVKVAVRAGGSIAGVVLDSERKPVSGAWINANPAKPGAEDSYRAAMTTADGKFELTGLGEGPYSIMIQSQGGGHQPTTKEGVAVGTKDLEVVLASGLAIEGVLVKADGKPVVGVYLQAVRVQAEGDEGGTSYGGPMMATDAQGKFRIAGLSPGKYTLQLNDWSGTGTGVRLPSMEPVAAGTKDLRIVATEGQKIAGVVVDETGGAVKGARVQVSVQNGSDRSATADAEGRFEVTGLGEEKVSLTASAAGRAQTRVTNIAPGARDVRVVMPKGLTLSGRMLDAAGKPLQGWFHVMQVKSDGNDDGSTSISGQSGVDGKFSVEGLREGRWKVSVYVTDPAHENTWTSVDIGTVEAGTTDAELRLPK